MGNVFEFPLKQHIGNKAAACVVKGDVIHRGQLLALQGDGLGCNIFSSVSGKVLEITDESVPEETASDEFEVSAGEEEDSEETPAPAEDSKETAVQRAYLGA